MNGRLRWPVLLAIAAGLAITVWAMGSVGFADIAHSIGRLGIAGFGLLLLASAVVNLLLGAAWLASMPGEPWSRWLAFTWARIAREAASDLLPFAQIGGLVVGTRTLTARGIAATRVYAAMIVDLTTEMFAQLLFTLLGLSIVGSLLFGPSDAVSVKPMIWAGTALVIATTLAFATLQRPALRFAGFLAQRVLPDTGGRIDGILAELAGFYRARFSIFMAFVFNFLAWTASAGCAWLILAIIHQAPSFWNVVGLESLIFAVRGAAFFMPGALGFQEAAYVLLAATFGITPEAAVAMSLIKRARDVAIGLPSLVVWQIAEVRSGLKRGATA